MADVRCTLGRAILGVAILFLAGAVNAFAQGATGTLSGTVVDSTGGALGTAGGETASVQAVARSIASAIAPMRVPWTLGCIWNLEANDLLCARPASRTREAEHACDLGHREGAEGRRWAVGGGR